MGMPIELSGGNAGDGHDIVVAGQRLTGEGLAAEETPPTYNQI
jgi:hypothetical protein